MDIIDKPNVQAVNGRDETDESSPDYALSLIIDKINDIVEWINTQ
jgi:hypothetical protein